MSVSDKLRGRAVRFGSARSGQVTFLFGLMVIPILCAVGAGLDYGRQRAAKVRLDAALDAAVLSIASRKSNVFNPVEVQQTLGAQFRKQAELLPQTKVLPGDEGFKVWVTPTVSDVTIKAQYSAIVGTTLTRLMNFDGMKLQGTASAARNFARYMDFYLLLDNSPSMGLAASQADIDKMLAYTKTQHPGDSSKGIPTRKDCAFACHETPKSGAAEDYADNYWLAKNKGVKLRIDNLRDATMGLVDKAVQTKTLTDQFRMAVYTFSDTFQKVAPLTPVLPTIKDNAKAIDLARSYASQTDRQTSYINALPKVSAEMPDSGSGILPTAPIRFLFFVTDGVQDAPLGSHQVDSDFEMITKYDSNRFIGAIDPDLCTDMRDRRGIRIGIIYTTYLPLPKNGYYMDHVWPFESKNKIYNNLKACATEGLFFPVSVNDDIPTAMNKLFDAAVSSVRLTN